MSTLMHSPGHRARALDPVGRGSSVGGTGSQILDESPHPYSLLAERAAGICLLTRLWAASPDAHRGVRHSER